MKFLIITYPSDPHAHAVAWGLRALGVEVAMTFLSDLPQLGSLTFSPNDRRLSFQRKGYSIETADFSGVWIRKMADAILSPNLHPDDRRNARIGWQSNIDSLAYSLEQSVDFVMGGKGCADTSDRKVTQLYAASRVGLIYPKTVITNDKFQARSFIRMNAEKGNKTIAKGLHTDAWDLGEDGCAILNTRFISENEIKDNIKHSAIIFQEYSSKKFEVRMVYFNGAIISVQLDVNSVDDGDIDYKISGQWDKLGCKEIDTPENVRKSVSDFCSEVGCSFAILDFIVNLDNDWIFLEANPFGQFLWMDRVNVDLNILGRLVEHIYLSLSGGACVPQDINMINYKNFETYCASSYHEVMNAEKEGHVNPI